MNVLVIGHTIGYALSQIVFQPTVQLLSMSRGFSDDEHDTDTHADASAGTHSEGAAGAASHGDHLVVAVPEDRRASPAAQVSCFW